MKEFFRNLVILCCLCPIVASAQSFEEYKRQQQEKYKSYAQKKAEEFRAYRDRVNAEYADYMRKAWTKEEAQPAKPLPKRPEPPKPEMRKPLDMPKFDVIPIGDIIASEKPDLKKPIPIIPIAELERLVINEKSNENVNDNENHNDNVNLNGNENKKETQNEKPKAEGFAFQWCGQTWRVPLEPQHRFRLRGTKEGDVADAWKTLSEAKYAGIVAACLKIRDSYQLPDWSYLQFLKAMADAFLPGMKNEARLLDMFILSQSGYQVRIARSNDQLHLLVPSSGEIYEYTYLTIGGRKYYVTDKTSGRASFFVYERDFPREQPFTWQISKLPLLSAESTTRTLKAQRYPEVEATVNVSKGLVELMSQYPRCNNCNYYALASLSEQAKKGLYPALRQKIEGKNKLAAVDILLDFVQTAFKYQTDDQQFGDERPLFGDETLFYPYCDCEDRSILFSILVRELVGQDVVLLSYPEHMATAVQFDDDVQGDHMMVDGKRYVVCDPTFIGSHVGEAMPRFKKAKATIIKL